MNNIFIFFGFGLVIYGGLPLVCVLWGDLYVVRVHFGPTQRFFCAWRLVGVVGFDGGMSNVVKFYAADAAKDPDAVLEQAVGVYDVVLVLGWAKDGELEVRGSLNNTIEGDLFLVDLFRHKLLAGDFCE